MVFGFPWRKVLSTPECRGIFPMPGKLASGMTIKIYDCFYGFTRFLCLSFCHSPLVAFCTRYTLTLMSVKVDSLILANGIIGHGQSAGTVSGTFFCKGNAHSGKDLEMPGRECQLSTELNCSQ